MVDLNCHIQKCGFSLWSVRAELVRFLLKKDPGDRDMENWFEGGGTAVLSGCCNQLIEK